MAQQRDILWYPDTETISRSRIHNYQIWLETEYNIKIKDYEQLWQWSVDDIERFWESIIRYFNVQFHTTYERILTPGQFPDVEWCKGGTLNYAEHIWNAIAPLKTVIHFKNEDKNIDSISSQKFKMEVVKVQTFLKNAGVKKGDIVAGYLPNIPEAVYACVAAIGLGAIWTCCSPDFGVKGVLDRFEQLQPTVLIAANGYRYSGKLHDKTEVVTSVKEKISSVKQVLWIENIPVENKVDDISFIPYNELVVSEHDHWECVPVEFSHPVWILFSSGTTGLPKPIIHSHGGNLLEHLKYLAFHNDVHKGENFFWYTTTGWMMWNFQLGALLHGASICLYDGSPSYPNLNVLWDFAASLPIHHFGTSAPFLIGCMKVGIEPWMKYDLQHLRSIGSTGSPLPPEAFDWVYKNIHKKVWLCSMSGGTDVCTAFVGGVITKPVVEGEIQGRGLGCSLFAYNENNVPVIGELGDMVITKAMPSMPVGFWNDHNKENYKASYFEHIPGVWRHGDWVEITQGGGVIIYGRSDATLNRQGIRIGTAEIYNVLDEIPEIQDSLIVNLELEGGKHFMPLFIKLKSGATFSLSLTQTINQTLRTKCTPRHVPDKIYEVSDIPYTISGKKMEAPVKNILLKRNLNSINTGAMRNPESLDYFYAFKIPD